MSFIFQQPPPPARLPEEDAVQNALHAALSTFNIGSSASHQAWAAAHSSSSHSDHHEMHRERVEKHQSSLDIVVTNDVLCLRGTGVDVAPALLSGHVVLYLHEPMSLKQITLSLKGKARIPVSGADTISLQSSQLTYLVCNHEWSFLEGQKGHSHTLKAGRHLFPFQLQLGGCLPSSIGTTAFGGASVSYKLQATAIRSGFSLTHRDLNATCPIYVVRALSAEALEYQQTLEIENTWPEKLMYSIMLPHKAWAAGEKVTAVVKFSPLKKGAKVLNISTTVNESIKVYGRAGVQETTRAVCTTRHSIAHGQAVLSEEHHHRNRIPLIGSSSSPGSPQIPGTPGSVLSGGGYFPPTSPLESAEMAPLTTTTTNSSSSSGSQVSGPSISPMRTRSTISSSDNSHPIASTSTSSSNSNGAGPSTSSNDSQTRIVGGIELPAELADDAESNDVVTTLNISLPTYASPSHNLEPIQVTHRIRWSILIGNKDGHTSELRCSLPLQILDHRLIEEARAATLATRRLLLGSHDFEGGQAVGTHGESDDTEDDMDLPSYSDHVRDRVANAFLPDAGVMRVTNPWIAHGVSPVIISDSAPSTGHQTPWNMEAFAIGNHILPSSTSSSGGRSQLPSNPRSAPPELEWVNSELLLSLTEHPDAPGHTVNGNSSAVGPPADSANTSRHGSRFPSRRGSRAPSRNGSPERRSSEGRPSTSPISPTSISNPNETFVHNSNTASRNTHGLFHMSMKPFSSIAHSFSLTGSSRNTSRSDLQSHFPHGHSHLSSSTSASAATSTDHHPSNSSSSIILSAPSGSTNTSGSASPSPTTLSPSASALQITPLNTSARPTTSDPVSGPMLLHRAFTETPDYEVARRGFLGGGVPPLESLRGLPSYADAAAESGATINGNGHGRDETVVVASPTALTP